MNYARLILPTLLLLDLGGAGLANRAVLPGNEPAHTPLVLKSPIQDKNFYFLSLLQRDAHAYGEIQSSLPLSAVAKTKIKALRESNANTDFGKISVLASLLFTEDEITKVASELSDLVRTGKLTAFVTALRRSGTYQRFADTTDEDLVAQAWRDVALGINRVLHVYGLQDQNPHSSGIDSPLYKPTNPLFGALVKTALGTAIDVSSSDPAFFGPSLDIALRLLQVQLRDEAGRHEPMESSVNAAAYRAIRKTDFSKYLYSCILVPGYGAEEEKVPLSPAGRLGLELAVKRYREHLAPFLIVSGGYVHPERTPYSEAIEMRRCLMNEFHIPERAILLDPHARHTTTNVRNAARILYRYGMPFDKPGLIVTNVFQSRDIESKAFANRCMNEFGYLPARQYTRRSEFDLEFLPAIISLSIDSRDPLDP